MKVTIIAVGSLKEKYLKDAVAEYKKRLSKYSVVDIVELADEANIKDEKKVKELEGKKIISALPKSSYVVMLDLGGQQLDSVQFAHKIKDIQTYNNANITFLIGGSLGFSEEVYKIADYKICFSKMTFPHQLMRVFLLEQIYRSFKILNNEPYHK